MINLSVLTRKLEERTAKPVSKTNLCKAMRNVPRRQASRPPSFFKDREQGAGLWLLLKFIFMKWLISCGLLAGGIASQAEKAPRTPAFERKSGRLGACLDFRITHLLDTLIPAVLAFCRGGVLASIRSQVLPGGHAT